MQIELNELHALLNPVKKAESIAPDVSEDLGTNIVVLDRGWVYVGKVIITPDWVEITNARNIRVWGTKTGLGQLADGPLPDTKLDNTGTVKASRKALIHLIKCTRDW